MGFLDFRPGLISHENVPLCVKIRDSVSRKADMKNSVQG